MTANVLSGFNPALFESHVADRASEALEQFKKISRSYALFHVLFFGIALVELFSIALFFSFFAKSSLLAFALAAIFLTAFSYFVLLFYFQAKKPEQLMQLRNYYIQECKRAMPLEKGLPEYHLSIAHAIYQLIGKLHHLEYRFYQFPKELQSLLPVLEKFSTWAHWKDIHSMKELLLLYSIHEQITLIKAKPTDLEAHASLATAYTTLGKLYQDPRKQDPDLKVQWISAEYFSLEMQQKFTKAAERAIEEFKILDYYSPRDPWVHAQLASIYHDLDKPQEEIKEYEEILTISPQDRDVLFRLGILYFQQGLNAQGLQVYEKLKETEDSKAAELISYYDAYLI